MRSGYQIRIARRIGQQVTVCVERDLNGRMSHPDLQALQVDALFDPGAGGSVT